MSRRFCARSIRAGQFGVRPHIWEPCQEKQFQSMPKQYRNMSPNRANEPFGTLPPKTMFEGCSNWGYGGVGDGHLSIMGMQHESQASSRVCFRNCTAASSRLRRASSASTPFLKAYAGATVISAGGLNRVQVRMDVHKTCKIQVKSNVIFQHVKPNVKPHVKAQHV